MKQRMAKVKLHIYIYFFHLKFVKMKKIFIILALKQPKSEERIFALYKYSRRLLTRTLSSKFVSNNLLVSKSNSSVCNKFITSWTSVDVTCTLIVLWTLNRQAKIFLGNSSVFLLFVFLRIRCVKLKICEWICTNIRHIT